jgi:hypothetical protein
MHWSVADSLNTIATNYYRQTNDTLQLGNTLYFSGKIYMSVNKPDLAIDIVDKKTLKGAFFKLENDFLGNIEIEWPIYSFNNGYFIRNYDPGDLFDALEKLLQSGKKLSPEMRDKLTKLKDSITDNDNNYILYAKLKE